jgi:hypothetical protein
MLLISQRLAVRSVELLLVWRVVVQKWHAKLGVCGGKRTLARHDSRLSAGLALEWIARANTKIAPSIGTEKNRKVVISANPLVPGSALAENQQVLRLYTIFGTLDLRCSINCRHLLQKGRAAPIWSIG